MDDIEKSVGIAVELGFSREWPAQVLLQIESFANTTNIDLGSFTEQELEALRQSLYCAMRDIKHIQERNND